jgi:hypothetical protein
MRQMRRQHPATLRLPPEFLKECTMLLALFLVLKNAQLHRLTDSSNNN